MVKVLNLEGVISPDTLATYIANKYMEWERLRDAQVERWKEVQQYVFATDTTFTRNSQLPWSNKTTIPKLCQIRDNLYANYMAAMFPNREWLMWEGATPNDDRYDRKQAIESYMQWLTDREQYYSEASKLVYDFIDYGNIFVTAEWQDRRNIHNKQNSSEGHFVGAVMRRISPLDIVFNAAAPSFVEAPKIVRSFISLGEIEQMLYQPTMEEDERQYLTDLLEYMKAYRREIVEWDGRIEVKDEIFNIAGHDSFREYLESGTVEVLTYYGDTYNHETGEYKQDQIVKVVDRHKLLSQMDNPSYLGHAPIFHAGWRIRQDTLWGMGPLENLIGMQYRIDHIENMKADLIDITALPPLKVSGYVEDFEWAPMERIDVGDNGNVEMLIPRVDALQWNTELAILEQKMEEMAGAPKEAMGFRTPGEKTKYEVQRIENAASRIFQSKLIQIERDGFEPALNYMLELAKRNLEVATIRLEDEEGTPEFMEITAADITGVGRLRPMAARHFAEKAEMIQNLTGFFSSAIGADPDVKVHFSSIKLARMLNDLLGVEKYELVEPFIRIMEQQDMQRYIQAGQEEVATEAMTPSGLTADDISPEALDQALSEFEGPPAGPEGEFSQ